MVAAGVAAASLPFDAFVARGALAAPAGRGGAGYGPLYPTKDMTTGLELLKLPRGFEYMSFGWTGDVMSDGIATPSNHDGMAAFRHADGVHLVRNHEKNAGTPFLPGGDAATYNPDASGGTTTLVFDPDAGRLVESYGSLSGTIRNCAGGPTPWGSWLTCEETTTTLNGVRHGYVFDVPSAGKAVATPLKAMGRFSHEAVAIDPATGIVYLTEDAGSSALYRFTPDRPGDLTSGTLEAMGLEGTTTTESWQTGDQAPVAEWVRIDNPDPDLANGEPRTWDQASAQGAARIVRGEGAWYGNGVIYVVSTSGGPAREGQIFAYDPVADTFRALFVSPGAGTLDSPDNICVSPRGGLVLCEDGGGTEYLHGLTPEGEIFPFAENAVVIPDGGASGKSARPGSYTGSEWCGAVFEPKNGNWLFANIQSPGITFAITGPWRQGGL